MCKTPSEIIDLLKYCADNQNQATVDWHQEKPDKSFFTSNKLQDLVLFQHYCNFQLWHTEDKARATDFSDKIIADCKRLIDKLNQQRNDAMEKVDKQLLNILEPILPKKNRQHYNTESPGLVIDRLSILSLKIYHMREQTLRNDVNELHKKNCDTKLTVLDEQRNDLIQSLCDLIADYCSGVKLPKLYYQFKMYNDPTLNPELYKKNQL